MAAVSVIVPVYEVERYVHECLRSIAAQTLRDLEVIVVDDGSTDAGPEIARSFAENDGRFRVVSQSNQGLGAARNAGLEQAQAPTVTFVDSDDVLPPDALALLHASLERTGSDFATGRVHRFDGTRDWPAPFLRKAFSRSRARTHITRFPWLVNDRTAWNKLWRRSFLDEHGLRFAEGVFNEDIPMVMPAHYLAGSVDVVAKPVYWWRTRDGSITARRLTLRMLLDRLAAVESVCDFLDDRFPAHAGVYYESLVAEDLRYHLDVLDEADDEYRAVFMERAAAFLARAPGRIEDRLPAIQRLKWHLVRRGLLDEVVEVVRFERDGGRARRTVRGGLVYGDYPFLDDPALGIPRSVYRLDTARRRARHVRTLIR